MVNLNLMWWVRNCFFHPYGFENYKKKRRGKAISPSYSYVTCFSLGWIIVSWTFTTFDSHFFFTIFPFLKQFLEWMIDFLMSSSIIRISYPWFFFFFQCLLFEYIWHNLNIKVKIEYRYTSLFISFHTLISISTLS